ncbi:MAG: flagellar biosynthesis anti-sigma factor FlgM [Halothiobacillaceae bacterium]|nr:MAG: flagellar biosynthesis anti-sigma factor FlgM [Halothiobacillaceae bacterium]
MTTINNLTQASRSYDVGTEDRGRAGQAPARNPSEAGAAATDSVTITETGSQMAATAREMAAAPAFDTAKVDRIKALIADGQYAMDPQRIADRFIELESALGRA